MLKLREFSKYGVSVQKVASLRCTRTGTGTGERGGLDGVEKTGAPTVPPTTTKSHSCFVGPLGVGFEGMVQGKTVAVGSGQGRGRRNRWTTYTLPVPRPYANLLRNPSVISPDN